MKRQAAAPKPRDAYLPFHVPSIDDADVQGVVETLRSGWLTTGPKTKAFEQSFAEYVGAPHAVAVNSCTAGLHVAMAALDMEPGDEIITTPYTFVASVETIISAGGKPVLVDVDAESLNIDPAKIERALTPRTRAIVPVHFAGRPCDMDPIMELARARGVPVIEDAAHALPAAYKGRAIGTIGDCTVFSFYATKNLTTGEGGMITTASEEMEARMRRLSLHGLSRDAWKRYAQGGAWFYEVVDLGFKYNMTDISASLGLTQLPRLEGYAQRREEIVARYRQALGGMPEIELPVSPDNARHAWHLYVMRLRPERLRIGRDEFIRRMNDMKIGVSVHFIPVHLHPYYRDRLSLAPEDLPVALSNYQREISLPIYPRMTDEDVDYVADVVRWIAEENRL